MGTAESMIGVLDQRELGEREVRSGLSYGCHVLDGRYYWLGGLSASGGSIEWLRSILGDPPLSYEQLESLSRAMDEAPGHILYLPYLSGSGSPHSDSSARGAFIGLNASHGRAELLKAVLEGTAYEIEAIRQAAEQATRLKIELVFAAGGGTRNRRWMQIKADVSGCRFDILPFSEATLLGAALLAGAGCGYFASQEEALSSIAPSSSESIFPDKGRHVLYSRFYEQAYLTLQEPLRCYYKTATEKL
jgi:xylulokinase